MQGLVESGLPQRWLPDETLFSLCSRFHAASGNRLAATTCNALFGHKTQGCAHDFPARLEHFISVAGAALGNVHEIVEQRTVLPLYMRFADESMAAKVIAAAAQNSTGTLKFQLGLLTSRFRANHPLKACPACLVEDGRRWATAYWHREHQMPGVWVCQKHGVSLLASDLKATGVSRFQWLLPSWQQFPAPQVEHPDRNVVRLAAMIGGLLARTRIAFSPSVLRMTYRSALLSLGLIKANGQRLRHREAGIAYAAFLAPLVELEQLGGLPTSEHMAAAEISRLIGPNRSGIHPLRHLALAAWLYPSFDDFLDQYQAAKQERTAGEDLLVPQADPAAPEGDDRRRRFLELVTSGTPVTGAARRIGIDATTGMVWAAALGIETPRRPKVLKGDLRATLIDQLKKGIGKAEVANEGHVSLQTITNLLRTEMGLHDAWKQAQFANLQRHHRRRWARVTAANPLSGIKAARLTEPAAYAWLYRNDRDWLVAQSELMLRVVRDSQFRVDWDARDRQLSDTVRQVALGLVNEEPGRKIKLFQIYQRMPDLKAKLFKLDRLPLTRVAIFDVLGRSTGRS